MIESKRFLYLEFIKKFFKLIRINKWNNSKMCNRYELLFYRSGNIYV